MSYYIYSTSIECQNQTPGGYILDHSSVPRFRDVSTDSSMGTVPIAISVLTSLNGQNPGTELNFTFCRKCPELNSDRCSRAAWAAAAEFMNAFSRFSILISYVPVYRTVSSCIPYIHLTVANLRGLSRAVTGTIARVTVWMLRCATFACEISREILRENRTFRIRTLYRLREIRTLWHTA